ncbi:MAG: hypothetical protein WCI72_04480 [archaeon]
MEIKPLNLHEIKRIDANSILEQKLVGFITQINTGLAESYSEGKDWQFTYASVSVEDLGNRERLRLQKLFLDAGYNVSFDNGVPYDESPTRIIVQHDTRHH